MNGILEKVLSDMGKSKERKLVSLFYQIFGLHGAVQLNPKQFSAVV